MRASPPPFDVIDFEFAQLKLRWVNQAVWLPGTWPGPDTAAFSCAVPCSYNQCILSPPTPKSSRSTSATSPPTQPIPSPETSCAVVQWSAIFFGRKRSKATTERGRRNKSAERGRGFKWREPRGARGVGRSSHRRRPEPLVSQPTKSNGRLCTQRICG